MFSKKSLLIVALLLGHQAIAADCSTGDDCFAKADAKLIAGEYEAAFSLAKAGCEQGNADACAIVGTQYQLGRGVARDIKASATYLEKSCELGSADGCAVLTSAYVNGNQGFAKDYKKALKMATLGCEKENALSCMLLGGMQINGWGTEKDPVAGAANLDKACALDAQIVCPPC
ncbi:tetratricopeptide repeat protein [Suttonella ornithocola]|uniref:Beta-lactamase hcpC n=1 Tax=Suttonella ornithocola TaxID=279832 RepID=A0A380N018_9GAMM|nr:tetratricopeptide repeat protein [Suttonella ornithocola]SUO97824.1 Putative beta-lactamase hcpC precursor [Suttonella ornithocola]